jgi:hypothetical protein
MKKILSLVFLSLFIILSSCNKEEEIKNSNDDLLGSTKKAVSPNVRCFENYDELYEEILTLSEMSFVDLCAYETLNGFNSFGKSSEKVYYSIIESDTSLSYAEVSEYVSEYSDYLGLEEDSIGEYYFEPKMSCSIYRYIMNKDRIFQVGDTLFKIFDNKYATCESKYYDDLLKVTEEDLRGIGDGDLPGISGHLIIVPTQHSGSGTNLGWELEKIATNGRERVRATLTYSNHYSSGQTRYYVVTLTTRGLHRTLGVWFWCKRTISQNIGADFYINNQHLYREDAYTASSPKYSRQVILSNGNYIVPNGYYDYQVSYLSSTHGTARIPTVQVNFNF